MSDLAGRIAKVGGDQIQILRAQLAEREGGYESLMEDLIGSAFNGLELEATNAAQAEEIERLRGHLFNVVATLEHPGWANVVAAAHRAGTDYNGPTVDLVAINKAMASRDSDEPGGAGRWRGLVNDALADMAAIDDGQWHEHSGDVTLSEDQAGCIREAREFLKQALEGDG